MFLVGGDIDFDRKRFKAGDNKFVTLKVTYREVITVF